MFKNNFTKTSSVIFLILTLFFVQNTKAATFQQILPVWQKTVTSHTKIQIQSEKVRVDWVVEPKATEITVIIKKVVNARDKALAEKQLQMMQVQTQEDANFLQIYSPYRDEVSGLGSANSSANSSANLGAAAEDIFLQVEIKGASAPLAIFSHHVTAHLKNFQSRFEVSALRGEITSKDSKGDWSVYLQHGEVNVVSHQGKLELSGYSAQFNVKDTDGFMDLDTWSGNISVQRSNGSLKLMSGQGVSDLALGKGDMDISNGRGNLKITDWLGAIKAQNGQGNLTVSVKERAELRIQTQEGNVWAKLPANSGAAVGLSAKEGSILVPEPLKVKIDEDQKVVSGQLGGPQSGVVRINSKSGQIRLSLN